MSATRQGLALPPRRASTTPRRAAPMLVAGASALMLLAACSTSAASSGGSSGGSSVRSQALIIAVNEPSATFDPVQADNSTVDEVVLPAYDTLVKFDSSQAIVPSIATAWKTSADGKSIDVTLRDNAIFHDGTKLTANDVQYTLDRIKKINIGVAALLSGYDATTVTDDTHLTIKLTAPNAPFIAALSRAYIVNSTLVKKNAASDYGQKWLATHDAGSGPYELKSYTPNQQAEFNQYPKYWGGFDGQAKTVIIKYITEAATQRSSLINGDIDLAMNIQPSDWASFASNKDFVVKKSDTNVRLSAFFKMKDSLLSNAKLREAITYAYNYQQHIDVIRRGAGSLAVGPLPSSMQCFDPSTPQATYDLAKAKALLAESGLSNVSLTMSYLSAIDEMSQSATLLQSTLKGIGVDLKLSAITYPQYVQETSKNSTTPDIGMIYAFPAVPDPDAVLYQNYDPKFISGGQNWGGYNNPTVTSLVEKAQTISDPAARCDLYKQAQILIAADNPAINISNTQYVTIYNKRVTGYVYEASHHQTVDFYQIKVS